jgi:hypothetical protein
MIMADSILDQLVELRPFILACGHPSFLDNGYADVFEADTRLDQEAWEEATWQINNLLEANCKEKEKYQEFFPVAGGKQCLAYRTVGDPCGALTRYKTGACKGAKLLRDYSGIAPHDELLDKSSPHTWTYAVFYWLGVDPAMAHSLRTESLNEVDLRSVDNEGPGMVEVRRLILPDTVIGSSVIAIDWLRQLLAEPLKDASIEWDICRVLSNGRSLLRKEVQSELAVGAAPGHVKDICSALVKRQILGKRPRRRGYYLTEIGKIFFAAAR